MNAETDPLHLLVGEWDLEATHPMVPGVVVRGKATFEWIDGDGFLLMRSSNDHPDFPNSASIIGRAAVDRGGEPQDDDEALRLFYFDSRGVHRVYELSLTREAWEWRRDSPELSQRFRATFEEDGDVLAGQGRMSRDGETWEDDIAMTYRRVGKRA